jgi:hypothetical protein
MNNMMLHDLQFFAQKNTIHTLGTLVTSILRPKCAQLHMMCDAICDVKE